MGSSRGNNGTVFQGEQTRRGLIAPLRLTRRNAPSPGQFRALF